MAVHAFESRELALKSFLKVERTEDIGRTLVEAALKKCSNCSERGSDRKKRHVDGNLSLEAGEDERRSGEGGDGVIQRAIDYVTESLQKVIVDLTPSEVASAIISKLSTDSIKTLAAFINQAYSYIGFEGNQSEKKAKTANVSAYQSLNKLAASVFSIFTTDWVEDGVSSAWATVTKTLSRIFRGVEGAFLLIDRALNLSHFIRLAFRQIFDLLYSIASTLSAGFRLIYEQAVAFIPHAYSIGKNILDRVTDGENALKALFECGRIINDRLGMAAMVLRIRSMAEAEELSTLETSVDSIPSVMADCFDQIMKLLKTTVGICDGYSADAIDASPEEKIEKKSVVRDFKQWLTYNPLFKALMSYASKAAEEVDSGWKYFAGALINSIQKITAVLSSSLFLALFAVSAFVGNQTATNLLSHMAITSATLSSSVSNRRALAAIGMEVDENSMRIEEDSVDQMLNTVSDAEKETTEAVVMAQTSYTYPNIVKSARELVNVFKTEMPAETAYTITKLADRLEKASDTQNMHHNFNALFKNSTPQSRKAMKRLLDSISYVHSNTDAHFREALADLDTKEARDAKGTLRELKAMLVEKNEEMKSAALALLRAMSLFERVPQTSSDKPIKKKKKSKYEDARTTFDAKLAATALNELTFDPNDPDNNNDKGFLNLVFMKTKEFAVGAILAVKGNFLMPLSAIVITVLVSCIIGPGASQACAYIISQPQHFIGSQLATLSLPHATGLFFNTPELKEDSPELDQPKSIVKDSVKRILAMFSGDVRSECIKVDQVRTLSLTGYKYARTVTPTDVFDANKCVVRPVEELSGRLASLSAIAKMLAQNFPTGAIGKASQDFLANVGGLDVEKEIDLPGSAKRFQETFAAAGNGDKTVAQSFFNQFDTSVEQVNGKIKDYVKTLSSFYAETDEYDQYRAAARQFRTNARSEWLDAEKVAFKQIVGNDPVGLDTEDVENVPEELRVRLVLLPTPGEQYTFYQSVLRSNFYSRFYAAFTTTNIQSISRLSMIYLMLFRAAWTMNAVLLVQLISLPVTHYLFKKLFKNYNDGGVAASLDRFEAIERYSFWGSQFIGKVIYTVLKWGRIIMTTFLMTGWSAFLGSMFYTGLGMVVSGELLRVVLTQFLVTISAKATAVAASNVTGRFVKVDGWAGSRNRNKTLKVQ